MNRPPTPPGSARFEGVSRIVPTSAIVPLKPLRPTIKHSQKYRQIAASVETVGLVELPVIIPDTRKSGTYYLLDGQLRLEVLKDLGVQEVECLVATDDEAYTYNKRINRLSVVQEHRMIVRAVERGVPEERLATALNLSVTTIHQRFRLLEGLCPEAIALLADKQHCTMVLINLLKRMKPMRQIQAAELIVGQNNYSSSFARSILAATPDEQLLVPRPGKSAAEGTREQIARLERELEATQRRTRFVEDSFGDDNLCLTVAQTYLNTLLGKPRVVRWLSQHRADYLSEFQAIVSLTSLTPTKEVRSNRRLSGGHHEDNHPTA